MTLRAYELTSETFSSEDLNVIPQNEHMSEETAKPDLDTESPHFKNP